MKIDRREITEKIVYEWECSMCGYVSELEDDPEETLICDNCYNIFEIEDVEND